MPEDYLVKSGAKDMLATAIAEVLTLRPRVPMAFLAAHFQGMVSNKFAAAISCLRACHPSSPSFPSAVEKVFHDLAAIETTPSLSTSGSSDSLPSRSSSAVGQGAAPSRKVRAGGPSTISEASFLQILQQLSMDFPKHLQTRVVEAALSLTNSTNTKEPPNSQGVGLARFHRGVQACLFLEELLDAATLLFQALDPHSSGFAGLSAVVPADTLVNALRSAATTQFPRELTSVLLPLLARTPALQPTPISSELTKTGADAELEIATNSHLFQIDDAYDMFFDLAFLS
ncbi:hypothetical protein PR003_g26869 [Phytophthora rubi]|uniref:Uncharacterized protein n=2 Tax=Phytophthora rubi TaxID=129364 RepID=A0A6A4CC48_9STRA|nr:hypothetical protein PR002_g26735 [Phytophthora rubi]KAE9284378.1 hypothetical protein PR003_g26869 [Phytophthora rubi]